MYEIIKEAVITILQNLIKEMKKIEEEILDINIQLNKNKKIIKGKIIYVVNNEIEKIQLENLNKRRETIKIKLSMLPSYKEINTIVYLLEENKEIKSKHKNVIINLPFGQEDSLSEICEYLFEAHNKKVKLDIIIKQRQEKLKKINTKVITNLNTQPQQTNPNFQNQQIYFSNHEENFDLSPYALYLYDLLEDSNNYEIIQNQLTNQLQENNYKIYSEILKILIIEYKELKKINDVYSLQRIAEKIMFLQNIEYNDKISKLPPTDNDEYKENHLHFAKNKNDNPYLIQDLKNIPSELYESCEKILKGLKTNTLKSLNPKKLINNNKLNNIWEVKNDIIRLFYKNIGNNNIQLILIAIKKTQNDMLLIKQVQLREELTNQQYLDLKNKIHIKNLTQATLDKENEIYQLVLEILSSKTKLK